MKYSKVAIESLIVSSALLIAAISLMTLMLSCGGVPTQGTQGRQVEKDSEGQCYLKGHADGVEIICDDQSYVVSDGTDGSDGNVGATGVAGDDGDAGIQGIPGTVAYFKNIGVRDSENRLVGRILQQLSDVEVRVVTGDNLIMNIKLATGMSKLGGNNTYQYGVFSENDCTGDSFALYPLQEKFRSFSFKPVTIAKDGELLAVDFDKPVPAGQDYAKSYWEPETETCMQQNLKSQFANRVFETYSTGIYFDFTGPFTIVLD